MKERQNCSTPRALHDTAIGIRATGTSRETGSMGEIEVPADRDWGAHRQRSRVHFSIEQVDLCEHQPGASASK
jgi:hypothetical protein